MIDIQAWAAENVAKLVIVGVVILILTGTHLGAYFYGKAVQRETFAGQENKILAKELVEKNKEIELNANEAEKVGRKEAEREARAERGMEELNDAISEAGVDPNCDLTDAELRALEALSES